MTVIESEGPVQLVQVDYRDKRGRRKTEWLVTAEFQSGEGFVLGKASTLHRAKALFIANACVYFAFERHIAGRKATAQQEPGVFPMAPILSGRPVLRLV